MYGDARVTNPPYRGPVCVNRSLKRLPAPRPPPAKSERLLLEISRLEARAYSGTSTSAGARATLPPPTATCTPCAAACCPKGNGGGGHSVSYVRKQKGFLEKSTNTKVNRMRPLSQPRVVSPCSDVCVVTDLFFPYRRRGAYFCSGLFTNMPFDGAKSFEIRAKTKTNPNLCFFYRYCRCCGSEPCPSENLSAAPRIQTPETMVSGLCRGG